jgi:hypothetical protein
MTGVRGTLNREHSWDQLRGVSLTELCALLNASFVSCRRYNEKGEVIPWYLQAPVPPADRWRSEWYRGSFHLAKCVVSGVIQTLPLS